MELAHLAGDDAYPKAFAMDQVAQVTQSREVLVKSIQRISTAADGDERLLALPNEGKDRFVGLKAVGEEGRLSPVAVAAYLGTGKAFGFPVGDDGEVRCRWMGHRSPCKLWAKKSPQGLAAGDSYLRRNGN